MVLAVDQVNRKSEMELLYSHPFFATIFSLKGHIIKLIFLHAFDA